MGCWKLLFAALAASTLAGWQPVAQRPPAPPPAPGFTPTVDASGGAVAPELSEADRTMLMRN